jgi:hypothetical protein
MLLHNLSTVPTVFHATTQTSIYTLPIANLFFAKRYGHEPCAVQHSIFNGESWYGLRLGPR